MRSVIEISITLPTADNVLMRWKQVELQKTVKKLLVHDNPEFLKAEVKVRLIHE